MNNLSIAGYVPRRPEINVTQNGTPVTKFIVGVDDYNSQTKQNDKIWYTVTVWKDLAERCERWLNKGSKVICTGKPSFRAWVNRDGEAKCNAEMTAFTVEFIHGMTDNYSVDNTSEPEKWTPMQPGETDVFAPEEVQSAK